MSDDVKAPALSPAEGAIPPAETPPASCPPLPPDLRAALDLIAAALVPLLVEIVAAAGRGKGR